MKIPFSVYDFFGYLAAGFLVLAAIDFSCKGGWLLKDTMALCASATRMAPSFLECRFAGRDPGTTRQPL